jgi:hypothetical protein
MPKITNTLDFNNFKGINLVDGVNPQDAATVNQVELAKRGIKRKDSVRAASTANLTLSGTQTVDGVGLLANDRILVKDQSTASANGIYTVLAGSWTRTADFNSSNDIVGSEVFISEGTVNGNKVYALITDAPITINTTALTFSIFGDGKTYTGGTGVTVTGTVIAIDTAIVAKKASATIGDGSATTITFTHNLNTQAVDVSVTEVATNAGVLTDWVANGVNTVQLTFGVAPTTGQYRVTVIG